MSLDYTAVRNVHMSAAALSITLFVARAAWLASAPHRRPLPGMRVVPHVVDSVLFAAGLWLALELGDAGTRGWLWAKLGALVLYVILGSIALRPRRPVRVRVTAFVLALLTFTYIAAVAVSKSPLPFVH